VNANGTGKGPSVSLEDIKNFRQLGSKCPGHPEYRLDHRRGNHHRTAGPGWRAPAWAWRWRDTGWRKISTVPASIVRLPVYTLCGDGDMMEGVSERSGVAGRHLKLANLCWIYDNNHITIEGNTDLAFSEDVATRFKGYGWNVIRVGDANDLEMLAKRVRRLSRHQRPPDADHRGQPHRLRRAHKQDTKEAHGEAAGRRGSQAHQAQLRLARRRQVPGPRRGDENFRRTGQARPRSCAAWAGKFDEYKRSFPDLAEAADLMQSRELPDGWDKDIPTFPGRCQGLGHAAIPRARC
jgi:transketolase